MTVLNRWLRPQWVIAAACCFGQLNTSAEAVEPQPFTVEDSIGMTRLVDPDASALSYVAPSFHVSADGRWFVIVTARGDLSSGLTTYKLLLFDAHEVRAFVNATRKTQLPRSIAIAQFATAKHRADSDRAIDQVRWLRDGKSVAFIGRDSRDLRQVFSLDIESRALRQLTFADSDVAAFDLSRNARHIGYATLSPPDFTARNRWGYAVKSDWMQDLGKLNSSEVAPEVRYFVEDLEAGRTVPARMAPGVSARLISVAPSGRWAIAFSQVRGIAREWREYQMLGDFANAAEAILNSDLPTKPASTLNEHDAILDDDVFGSESPGIGEFVLIDGQTGDTRSLLNAPAFATGAVVSAMWSADSSRVIVARTYLPLRDAAGEERERRRTNQAVVEVDIATGSVQRVADIPELDPIDHRPNVLLGVQMNGDDTLTVVSRHGGKPGDVVEAFVRRKEGWVRQRNAQRVGGDRLNLRIVQDMNTSPEIEAIDERTLRRRIITDLNPQFRDRTLGMVRPFEWTDRMGHRFTGGLVLPPNFSSAKSYPVVLQSGGFRPDMFLVDGFGWMTSAFAARPLANREMLVLQMPEAPYGRESTSKTDGEPRFVWQDDGEGPRFMAMMEGAIDALEAQKLIDRNRVGLIGFSRGGLWATHAITFSKYYIAAATIADGQAPTPFGQSVWYGTPFPVGIPEYESETYMGAPFWGKGIRQWEERSPAFHLDKIRAALRIESYGQGIPAQWDIFVQLKRHQRPVELIHIPVADHVLTNPSSRYTSQQGNVDWFSFWLRDYESADVAKQEMYARWRKLRALRDAMRVEKCTERWDLSTESHSVGMGQYAPDAKLQPHEAGCPN